MNYIALENLKIGKAYKLRARNIGIGIWDGEAFHGIRDKFGNKFMDKEIHWDLDEKYGTAQAIKELA